MLSFFAITFVPLVIFVSLVLPTWLVFHYLTKWKRMKMADLGDGMIAVPREDLEQLRARAKDLAGRLETLERILTTDSPDWRSKS
ncbi:MAG: envelope stress response membrane protein PspB [Rhodospirillum sp.]|nr:envelope stress response membrane protein PspB [Rhodospirillum sp.]MCF8490353.1 envelope stress response membrane protein PspB [Rhodospirillum sp.]MCF8501984.1 envelope stress response membrane protein PspB [Rhodospirillum sp.]